MAANPSVYPGTIAIVGGGITGVVLALALHHRGLRVHIYEAAHAFGEIGAGIGFHPAAIRAMAACAPGIPEVFQRVRTYNYSPEKRGTMLDIVDGRCSDTRPGSDYLFSLYSPDGLGATHRSHFLDGLVKLLPDGVAEFGKRLDTLEELPNGDLRLRFTDGTNATHPVVLGCDGIKSAVRSWMVGPDHPSAPPVYTHMSAYRGLVPMDRVIAALGEENAHNARCHIGKDGHMITFDLANGTIMNVVAFVRDPNDWVDARKLTCPADKKDVQEAFKDFGPMVRKIVDMLEPNLDRWAIFDTGDHPLDRYNKGRVLLVGDAAHATSPHHGSGAGMCIEDVAILAELLADPRVTAAGNKGIEAAFAAFSAQRLERTQWLVQSSRRTVDLYQFRTEHGEDVKKIEHEMQWRYEKIWKGQVSEYIAEARDLLAKNLQA